MNGHPNNPSNPGNVPAIQGADSQHLPSVDVREVMPVVEDEINLRDYLDVLVRRKWVVIIVLLVTFFSVALYTFTTTPLFLAQGVLKVSSQGANVTKFENLETNIVKMKEFQQTQVKLLQSEQLAGRVIAKLNLDENPLFNPQAAEAGESAGIGSQIKGIARAIRNFIRFQDDQQALQQLSEEAQQQILYDKVLKTFQESFEVTPVKNSELIEISFEAPESQLAARIVNTAMQEFLNMQMDSQVDIAKTAGQFLEKKILAAQIKLEQSEKALTEFSRRVGLVSLDPKLNLVMKQLEELNDALAKARTERISREAIYQQAISENSMNLPQILNDPLIQELKTQYAALQAEYQDLSITFKPAYPKMQQLAAKMKDISDRIESEKKRIIDSIKNEYETALKREQYLTQRAEQQKKKAIDLNDKATQYRILSREVDTNKSIYQSLLQRSKEIDATLGADALNIQIVDRARPPIVPYKPKIARNLLLGLLLGLFGGIGIAFVQEFLDNTIKNPDELVDRFHIPVLGLIPFDRENTEDKKRLALRFYHEPRAPMTESIRTAMTSVELSASENPPRTILVTSVLAGAGKSTFSSNAALSYLSSGEKCLLIDVDLRKASLHHIYADGDKGKGLSNVLTGTESLKKVIRKTEFDGLDFISSGPLPPNPAELLASKRMRQLLGIVGKQYDHVILDGPPFQGFAEILVLSNMVDGVILITVEGETPREGVRHFRKSVLNVGGRILGAIINKAGRKKGYGSYGYGSYKYYSYNYDYGEDLQDS